MNIDPATVRHMIFIVIAKSLLHVHTLFAHLLNFLSLFADKAPSNPNNFIVCEQFYCQHY